MRILCYIVAYNAAEFIENVLQCIPQECWNNPDYHFEVLVSDDCSTDSTLRVTQQYISRSERPITVRRTRRRLGYGGNQKLGYDYARQNGFDAVILLHGDGQYDPGCIPALLAPIISTRADAVLGSRMMNKRGALQGGMPLHKFIINIIFTKIQNALAGSGLSEFHTGYRAYSTRALSTILYKKNSDGFAFDSEIILQLLDARMRIAEIAIPTHYGKEKCHVNGPQYLWNILMATLCFRCHKLGLIRDGRLTDKPVSYANKTTFDSSHNFALRHCNESKKVADLGGGAGHVARALRARGCNVTGIDNSSTADSAESYDRFISTDLSSIDSLKEEYGISPDTVLCLDVLEHLENPQRLLTMLQTELPYGARVVITVPNVAFISMRLKLLLGCFTYGDRGILDRTHLRFFTFSTMRTLLEQTGFEIIACEGIPAPFPLVLGPKAGLLPLRVNRLLISLLRGLFAFQIGIVATPRRSGWET